MSDISFTHLGRDEFDNLWGEYEVRFRGRTIGRVRRKRSRWLYRRPGYEWSRTWRSRADAARSLVMDIPELRKLLMNEAEQRNAPAVRI